jgi:hypothetical protein
MPMIEFPSLSPNPRSGIDTDPNQSTGGWVELDERQTVRLGDAAGLATGSAAAAGDTQLVQVWFSAEQCRK